jgi:drug/metabolite transporter (DMT)-like permease
MEKKDRLLPVAAAAAGNIFWGFSFLFTRVALLETTPEIMLALRFAISFALMNVPLLLGRQKLRLKGKKLLPLLGLAVAEPVIFYSESYGILYTNATFTGVMVAIAPVFATALAALVLKEYPSRRQLVFCLLPIVGVIIMVLAGKSLGVVTPLGVVFLLINCVATGFYRLFNRWSSREFTPFERTYMVLLSCLIVFTTSALLSVEGNVQAMLAPVANPKVIFPVLALCLLCSIGSNMLVNYAAGRMSVAKISVFSSLITLCSTFGGVVILGEPFSVSALLGTVLIVYGVWQVSRPEQEKKE